MKICLDPGHSGKIEPGACSGGVTEAVINLEVAKIAGRMLEKFGHKVLLTRTGEVDNYWLSWRCEAAWAFGADIFVSIHCNACEDETVTGTETFYFLGSETGHANAVGLGLGRNVHHVGLALVVKMGQGVHDKSFPMKWPGSGRLTEPLRQAGIIRADPALMREAARPDDRSR